MKLRADSPRERGVILVTTLLFAMSALALSVTLALSAKATLDQKRRIVARGRAADAAESGMHHLAAALDTTKAKGLLSAGVLSGTLDGPESGARSVRYEVRVESAGDDGFDNDLDGNVDDPAEQQMYEAIAVGYADDIACGISTTLRRLAPTAAMPGALLWDNPALTLQLDTTGDKTFLDISGTDLDLNGNPTGLVTPGIAVNGDPAAFLSRLPRRYNEDIVGTGGNRSVHQAATPMDYESIIEYAREHYDVRLDKQGHPDKNTPQPWGTPQAPAVVYARGDYLGDHVDLDKRKVVGAGILVIDGSLEVADAKAVLDWTGLVIVRSKLLVDSDALFRVVGGMVVYGPYQHSQIDDARVTIQYSTEALSAALGIISPSGFMIFNWREAAVPCALADLDVTADAKVEEPVR